jgi:hypothetical protein
MNVWMYQNGLDGGSALNGLVNNPFKASNRPCSRKAMVVLSALMA